MYLFELHTTDPLPGNYAGSPVERPTPDVAVVDVDAVRITDGIDLALGWASHHRATVTAITIRGATLASLRRPPLPRIPSVSGDGWVDILHAARQLGQNRDEQMELMHRIHQAAADGRITVGRHPDHTTRVVRLDDARRVAAEAPQAEQPDDLVHVSEVVKQFGARAIDAAVESGTVRINSRFDDEAGWWFRRGDLALLPSRRLD